MTQIRERRKASLWLHFFVCFTLFCLFEISFHRGGSSWFMVYRFLRFLQCLQVNIKSPTHRKEVGLSANNMYILAKDKRLARINSRRACRKTRNQLRVEPHSIKILEIQPEKKKLIEKRDGGSQGSRVGKKQRRCREVKSFCKRERSSEKSERDYWN